MACEFGEECSWKVAIWKTEQMGWKH